MTPPRITTWQQPDDLWAYRLEDVCGTCERRFDDLVGEVIGKGVGKVPGHTMGSNWDWVPCPTCNGDGTVAYSQHGFHSRKLALVRAKQVIRERTLPARRGEETVEVEAL